MSSRVIVRNIPTNVDEKKLKEIFSKFGPVTDVKVCLKGNTHRRFCFIGYKSDSDAKKAKEYFNNTYIQMNKVQVDFAMTSDDPSLKMINSKRKVGEREGQQKQQQGDEEKGKKQFKKNENEQGEDNQKNKKNSSELTAEQKFQEFKRLMQGGSKGTMSWNDVLSTIQPAKNNKKNNKKVNGKGKKGEDEGEEETIALQELDEQFNKIKEKKNKDKPKEEETMEVEEEVTKESKKSKKQANQEGEVEGEDKKLKGEKDAKDADANSNIDSCRLYVLNLPYDITEEEVREVFRKYGQVTELKMPKGKGGQFRGFAYITYQQSGEAMRAFAQLDNKIQFGRILHIRPAFKEDKKEGIEQEKVTKTQEEIDQEKSSYKKKKKSDMKKNLSDDTNWNSLFLNPNAILETVATRYGVKKSDILAPDAENQAVRIAHAETQIIAETKEWMAKQGMSLDFLDKDRKSCERSNNTILIKNLASKVQEDSLRDLFNRYGSVTHFLLAPNKAIGVVQYDEPAHAANAFEKLSYFTIKNNPLYLEWAPIGMLEAEQVAEEQTKEQQIEEELSKVLYVKNLSFETTEAQLQKHFEKAQLGNIRSARIVFSNGKSQGYGFVEFIDAESVGKAIRKLQNSLLSGHALHLSVSKPQKKQETTGKGRKEKETNIPISTKVVIRNLAFEATKKDIRDLLKAYGELKAVRLPKKMNGQHRGFAFAEFSSAEEAKNAFSALENTHLYGRKLAIEWANVE